MDPFAQLLIQWIGMVCHPLLEASSEWEHVGDVSPVVDVLRRENMREAAVNSGHSLHLRSLRGPLQHGLHQDGEQGAGEICRYYRYHRYHMRSPPEEPHLA